MQPLRAGVATLRAALATPELRRLQAAWAAISLGTWSFFVVIAIYAFEQGGAAAVGLAALARMLPAGLTPRSRACSRTGGRAATCCSRRR